MAMLPHLTAFTSFCLATLTVGQQMQGQVMMNANIGLQRLQASAPMLVHAGGKIVHYFADVNNDGQVGWADAEKIAHSLADVNHDGKVSWADAEEIAHSLADVNHDGKVSWADAHLLADVNKDGEVGWVDGISLVDSNGNGSIDDDELPLAVTLAMTSMWASVLCFFKRRRSQQHLTEVEDEQSNNRPVLEIERAGDDHTKEDDEAELPRQEISSPPLQLLLRHVEGLRDKSLGDKDACFLQFRGRVAEMAGTIAGQHILDILYETGSSEVRRFVIEESLRLLRHGCVAFVEHSPILIDMLLSLDDSEQSKEVITHIVDNNLEEDLVTSALLTEYNPVRNAILRILQVLYIHKRLPDAPDCCICLQPLKRRVELMPCRHKCCCQSCACELWSTEHKQGRVPRCPYCRRNIIDVRRDWD